MIELIMKHDSSKDCRIQFGITFFRTEENSETGGVQFSLW